MDSADISPQELAESVLGDGAVEGATLTQRVKVLKVYRDDEFGAYKPYQQYIFDGSYPLFRQIYMINSQLLHRMLPVVSILCHRAYRTKNNNEDRYYKLPVSTSKEVELPER